MTTVDKERPNNGKRDLSISQAADRLGVHPNTVRRLIKSKRLPAYQLVRQWRITTEAIERLRGVTA